MVPTKMQARAIRLTMFEELGALDDEVEATLPRKASLTFEGTPHSRERISAKITLWMAAIAGQAMSQKPPEEKMADLQRLAVQVRAFISAVEGALDRYLGIARLGGPTERHLLATAMRDQTRAARDANRGSPKDTTPSGNLPSVD